jgi:hypothetical protein
MLGRISYGDSWTAPRVVSNSCSGSNRLDVEEIHKLNLPCGKMFFSDSTFPEFGGKQGYSLFSVLTDYGFGLTEVIETDKKEFHISDIVCERLPDKHLPHQQFADSFYELDQATNGVQEAGFRLARNFLELEKKNSADVFEAFGQKFPVESATRWGILIVIGIQFYFWVHLGEYRRRIFSKVNCAWIGVYKSPAARFLFCASALLFPVGTGFVCIKAGLLPPTTAVRNVVLSGLAIVVSAFLAVLTGLEYFRKQTLPC